MKKLLDIKYSKINHLENLLQKSEFYKKYKIGVITAYRNIVDITLGKKYREDGKFKITNLSTMNCRISLSKKEIFGHYDDQCGRNYSNRFCVLSEHKESYDMCIHNEHISGPYVEGYEHYEYGDGRSPMSEFAYGALGSKLTIFSLSKSLTDEEIITELDKVLAANDYWFNPEFKEKREHQRLLKKKEAELYILKKDMEKLDKEKSKKMNLYLKLQKEIEDKPIL